MDMTKKQSPFSSTIYENWIAASEKDMRVNFPVGLVEGFIIDNITSVNDRYIRADLSLQTDKGKATTNIAYFGPSKDRARNAEHYEKMLKDAVLEVMKLLACVYKDKPRPIIEVDSWEDFIRKVVISFAQGDALREPCAGVFEYNNNGYLRLRRWSDLQNIARMDSGIKLYLTGREILKRPVPVQNDEYEEKPTVAPHVVVDPDKSSVLPF